MGKKSLVLAIALLAPWSPPAFSEPDYESGNYWLKLCESAEPLAQNACTWFVYGFNQGITAQAIGSDARKIYCMPDTVTYGQAKDIWTKYMKDNPAERHKLGGVLLMTSMVKSFPCAGRRQ